MDTFIRGEIVNFLDDETPFRITHIAGDALPKGSICGFGGYRIENVEDPRTWVLVDECEIWKRSGQ